MNIKNVLMFVSIVSVLSICGLSGEPITIGTISPQTFEKPEGWKGTAMENIKSQVDVIDAALTKGGAMTPIDVARALGLNDDELD